MEDTIVLNDSFSISTPSAIFNDVLHLDELEEVIIEQEKEVGELETETLEESDSIMENSEPPLVQYEDINDLGDLYLQQGFEQKVTPTFAKSKTISGQGDIGTTVGILVADSITEGALNVTYVDYETTIGASGIYSKSFDLNIGTNYVIVATVSKYRVFTINRKEEETKELLENITIDFEPLVEEEIVEEVEILEDELEESIFDFLEILDISDIIDILK